MVVAVSGINIGLTIFGAVDPRLGNKLFPSGENIDFGYWRSWKDDSLTSTSGIFNQIYMPFDGTGVKRSNKPEVFDRVNNTNIIASGGHWAKAGANNIIEGAGGTADLGSVPRSIYLNEYDYINAGSGNTLGYTNKFSIYAKLMPSGEQLNTRIISKHKSNPAQMVLGTDALGLYYIRADGLDDDDDNVAYYAVSDKDYTLYDFPTQVVGVFGYTTEGTGAETKNSLALYVNGKLQGDVSPRFIRYSPEDRRADSVIIGNPEFAGQDGYRGWIDEVGIANYAISPSAVQRLYDNTFGLSNYLNENMGASGAYDFGFSQAFDAMDTNYVEFVVDSGNSQGQVGGAFDKSLWGNNLYSVSSQVNFGMDDLRGDAYQVTDNIYVDMWIKHDTNHFSGGYIQPSIQIKKGHDTLYNNIDWKATTVFLPSSVKRFQNIRFSGALGDLVPDESQPAHLAQSGRHNVFFEDGKRESRTDFNLHELNISLSYPSGTSAATTTQFRRNKPFQSSFKVYSAKVNVDAFVIPSTGSVELDLFTSGDTASSKTANIDLYLAAKNIVGNIDLYLQQNITRLQGSGVLSSAPVVATNKNATLYTKAGISDDLRLNSLSLLTKSVPGPGASGTDKASIDLFLEPSQYGTSGVRKWIDLFLDVADPVPAASGAFVASEGMNLFHRGAAYGALSKALELYVQPSKVGADSTFSSNELNLYARNELQLSDDSISLYAKTPPSITKSGTLNLFMLRKSGEFNQTELFLKGPFPSGTISLFNIGHTIKSSSISLYASGLGKLTHSTTPLVTKGYTSSS